MFTLLYFQVLNYGIKNKNKQNYTNRKIDAESDPTTSDKKEKYFDEHEQTFGGRLCPTQDNLEKTIILM